MFRDIRKKKNRISPEAAKQLLKNERRGVLAMQGVEGYPYAMPINFYYDEPANKIYFHGARAGHKVEALKVCDKVCFTVYGNETVKDLDWAPYMQSAIIFGRCRLIDDKAEGLEKIKKMAMKYYPGEDLVDKEIADSGNSVQVFEIEIEHMSGKEVQEI